MIKDILYILIFVGLFVSCDSEQFSSGTKDDTTTNNVLKLNISRTDFSDMAADDSRVSNSGTSTSFTEGDVIGVLVTQDGENYNLPYRYNGTDWEFDISSDKELFTKTTADELRFILYYPYSTEADGVTTLDGLKTALPVKTDQSSEADYISSDLLYAEVTTAESTVSANMRHLRALFTYKPKVKFQTTVAEEGGFESYALSLADISFSDEAGEIKCYKTTDGEYHYIVDKNNTITWVYDYAGAVYEGKKELVVTPGTKYATTEFINTGVYNESKAKIGDFYCIDGDEGYVLPLEFDIASSTHNCIGIVFHVGAGSGDSKENYAETSLASSDIRGYVVALKDAGNFPWASNEDLGGKLLTNKDKQLWIGYLNTKAVQEETLENYPAFNKCVNFDPIAPSGSSGWYLPSCAQLEAIFSQKKTLDKELQNVSGSQLIKEDWYWSSTQSDDNSQAVMYYLKDNGGTTDWGKPNFYNVRPVLTF